MEVPSEGGEEAERKGTEEIIRGNNCRLCLNDFEFSTTHGPGPRRRRHLAKRRGRNIDRELGMKHSAALHLRASPKLLNPGLHVKSSTYSRGRNYLRSTKKVLTYLCKFGHSADEVLTYLCENSAASRGVIGRD